jgi:hypothetical protein
LTERRAKAADVAGYEVHHFRKRIEPRICEHLAILLAADTAAANTRAVPPRLSRAARPLRLPADVFAWEAAQHEQAIAELWSAVYALRAALLAVAHQASMDGARHPETAAAAHQALLRLTRLHTAAAAYRVVYGPQLLGADPGTDPGDLAALAGWHPELDSATAAALAAAADSDPRDFWPSLPEPIVTAAHCWARELAEAFVIPPTK